MGVTAKRLLFGRNASDQPSRRSVEDEIGETGSLVTRRAWCYQAEDTGVSARGVIRLERVYLLTRFGTVYGLFDEQTAAYDCALKSDTYRLGEYVGDYVEVAGALADVGKELPMMNVTRLQLLKMKWMR